MESVSRIFRWTMTAQKSTTIAAKDSQEVECSCNITDPQAAKDQLLQWTSGTAEVVPLTEHLYEALVW